MGDSENFLADELRNSFPHIFLEEYSLIFYQGGNGTIQSRLYVAVDKLGDKYQKLMDGPTGVEYMIKFKSYLSEHIQKNYNFKPTLIFT